MNTTNNLIVDSIIDAMLSEITKYNLELLQRYPNDLLVHDRSVLEYAAIPGATIAWMVGDSHTHLVTLGLHKGESEMVRCLTNLSSNDRFYVLKVESSSFNLTELDRKQFMDLEHTNVPYSSHGSDSEFSIYKGKAEIGHIKLNHSIRNQQPFVEALITPIAVANKMDLVALRMWCSKGITRLAGTLFVKSEEHWVDPYQNFKEAA